MFDAAFDGRERQSTKASGRARADQARASSRAEPRRSSISERTSAAAFFLKSVPMMKTHTEHDTSVVKLDSARSPRGAMGEKYLASGVRVSMRLWDAEPATSESEARATESSRDYEVVGYVVAGRARLHVEDQVVTLNPGSSYVVPRGARHYYHVLEAFTAVEATSPPGQVHGRDAPISAHPVDPSNTEKL